MNFTEKLLKLTADRSKSKLSAEAGLPKTAISNYITKKQTPRADAAFAIARALKVPLDWLVDDDQDLPPPDRTAAVSGFRDATNGELLTELARRYRLDLLDAIRHAEEAEKIDWAGVWRELQHLQPDQIPDPALASKLHKLSAIVGGFAAINFKYDPRIAADLIHDKLPGQDRPIETTNFQHFVQRFTQLFQKPGAAESVNALSWPGVKKSISGQWIDVAFGNMLDLMDPERRLKLLRHPKPANAVEENSKSTKRHRSKK